MKKQYDDEACKTLATAVVKTALVDYNNACKKLKKGPTNAYAKYQKLTLEKWFHSPDFKIWCDADMDAVLRHIEKNGLKMNASYASGKARGKYEKKV